MNEGNKRVPQLYVTIDEDGVVSSYIVACDIYQAIDKNQLWDDVVGPFSREVVEKMIVFLEQIDAGEYDHEIEEEGDEWEEE